MDELDTSESAELSVCTDCIALITNGETPTEMDEEETAEFIARFEAQTEGFSHVGY